MKAAKKSLLVTLSIIALLATVQTKETVSKKIQSSLKSNGLGEMKKLFTQFKLLSEGNSEEELITGEDDSKPINYEQPIYEQAKEDEIILPEIITNSTSFTDAEQNEIEDVVPRKHNSDLETDASLRRTPVIGILTEPLRGTMKDREVTVSNYDEYIPAAHVKFIQQTGCKVVPVSYKLEEEDLIALLDQLNGLYIPGDSILSANTERYIWAFDSVMTYV